MRSLDVDVPKTISSVLSTHDFRGRKDLIEKVFTEDVKFWHLFFQTVNRKELFGVYQMWGKRDILLLCCQVNVAVDCMLLEHTQQGKACLSG